MPSKYRDDFFSTKRHWSIYKDAVLDYYLVPYLSKVKERKQPILIVDMFAGRGRFHSGEPGSPLIIAQALKTLNISGHPVFLQCYESHEPFYVQLTRELQPFGFAQAIHGSCLDHVDNIAKAAASRTVFLYIDPCNVTSIHLDMLAKVYRQIQHARASVEVMIVFMARAFMREAARVVRGEEDLIDQGPLGDKLILQSEAREDKEMWLHALYGEDEVSAVDRVWRAERELNAIAGGDYWKDIVRNGSLNWHDRCSALVDQYKVKMRKWFSLVDAYPIRSDIGSELPKYWLVFGSRYEPALDLFNRAACSACREQRHKYRQPGSLFAGVAIEEKPSDGAVDEATRALLSPNITLTWQQLRWHLCRGSNIGRFTDAEWNASIKRMLKSGMLAGASGDKVEDKVVLSPGPRLLARPVS